MSEVHVPPSQTQIRALAATVCRELAAHGLVCATAESCTGGLIGHLLTEVPGSSAIFMGAAVTYSNEAKHRVLGVDGALLDRHGAVSAEVATAMAWGARALYGTDLAVSVTGIAGPDGGTPEKPVGLVHMHLAGARNVDEPRRFVWRADRSGTKLLSAQAALELMLAYARTHGAREA